MAARSKPDPIARFNVVPHQLIELNDTFDVGILPFSKGGISKVVYTLTPASGTYNSGDGGWDGTKFTFDDVTSWSLNSRTNSWEYKITIDASLFSTSTEFDLDATVHGTSGGIVDKSSYSSETGLDTIKLYCDQAATLVRKIAFVDTGGTCTDNSGVLAYGTVKPALSAVYANVQTAIDKILAVNGTLDFCDIYLADGQDHTFGQTVGTKTNSFGWLTIAPDPATGSGRITSTRFNSTSPPANISIVPLIRYKDFKVGDRPNQTPFNTVVTSNLWLDNMYLQSNSQGNFSHPLWNTTALKVPSRVFATDSDFYYMVDGIGLHGQGGGLADGSRMQNNFIRGCTFDTLRDDATGMATLVLNCTFSNMDPVNKGPHTDISKWHTKEDEWIACENTIFCNNVAVDNCHFQGLFYMGQAIADYANVKRRMAVVNNVCKFNGHPFKFLGNHDHLLVYHNTFLAATDLISDPDGPNEWDQPAPGRSFFGTGRLDNVSRSSELVNLDVRGNIWDSLWLRGVNYPNLPPNSEVWDSTFAIYLDTSDFVSNNYWWPYDEAAETNSATPGSDVTTDNPRVSSSTYASRNLALHGRLTPVIPFDLNNDVRSDPTALGAVEGGAGGVTRSNPLGENIHHERRIVSF
jgi:hypothetical protein